MLSGMISRVLRDLTEALVTKSVMDTTSPECASTKASIQAPFVSFWICMTWAKTAVLSSLTRYSTVGGWLLNWPPRVLSADEMASSNEMVGVEDATDASDH